MTNFPGRDFMTLLLSLNNKFNPESKNITYDIIPELSHGFLSKIFPEYIQHLRLPLNLGIPFRLRPDSDPCCLPEPLLEPTSLSELFKYLYV